MADWLSIGGGEVAVGGGGGGGGGGVVVVFMTLSAAAAEEVGRSRRAWSTQCVAVFPSPPGHHWDCLGKKKEHTVVD